MAKQKILIADDEAQIREILRIYFEKEGFEVIEAEDGAAAILKVQSEKPDILLLDIMMPVLDGIEVCKQVRKMSDLPIIMVTAKDDDDDRIAGLEIGADDYITKPFSVNELLARLRATVRRLGIIAQQTEEPADPATFLNGELRIDYAAHLVYVQGHEVHLTPTEYKLLCTLAENAGKVLTHQYILRRVWGSSLPSDVASLRVFMVALRKKLESAPGTPHYIQTHVGIGYRLLREDEAR